MKSAKIFIVFAFLLTLALGVSAQSVQFPNELTGYEFSKNGKLKDLRLAFSSKRDVKKIFGANCEKRCDYDADWSIGFEYFEDIWIKEDRSSAGERMTNKLNPDYLGKLRSIELRPKKRISFADVSFPNAFQKLLLASTSVFDLDKNRMSGDEAFEDLNGLTYEILNQTIKYDGKKAYNKGDLVLIRYDIPKATEDNLFVLQK